MKIRVDFGIHGKRREVGWYQALEEFPNYIAFQGKNWEWIMWDTDRTGAFDYIATFIELLNYDPHWPKPLVNFEERFPSTLNECQCGSSYTSFKDFHMMYCPLWRKM